MKGALILISSILLVSSCVIFDDGDLKDQVGNLNLSEDTVAFHDFAIIELQKNDKFYNYDQSVSITFSGVTQDSRCPLDVVCVSEGSVSVKIALHDDGTEVISANFALPGSNNYFIYKNSYIRLLKVEPYPEHADTPIGEYTITMEIRPVDSDCQSTIIDPDQFNNPWNDDFTFTDVQIANGFIKPEIQYGGGCGDIHYEMVSNGGYSKTVPPQIDLRLSFKDEDDCEALITTTLCFDLQVLQVNPDGSTIQINLAGWDTPLMYTY